MPLTSITEGSKLWMYEAVSYVSGLGVQPPDISTIPAEGTMCPERGCVDSTGAIKGQWTSRAGVAHVKPTHKNQMPKPKAFAAAAGR